MRSLDKPIMQFPGTDPAAGRARSDPLGPGQGQGRSHQSPANPKRKMQKCKINDPRSKIQDPRSTIRDPQSTASGSGDTNTMSANPCTCRRGTSRTDAATVAAASGNRVSHQDCDVTLLGSHEREPPPPPLSSLWYLANGLFKPSLQPMSTVRWTRHSRVAGAFQTPSHEESCSI